MSTTNNGGPAFPCDIVVDQCGSVSKCDGMTLRDYFAAKAMQAHITGRGDFADSNKATIADAMLAAREVK